MALGFFRYLVNADSRLGETSTTSPNPSASFTVDTRSSFLGSWEFIRIHFLSAPQPDSSRRSHSMILAYIVELRAVAMLNPHRHFRPTIHIKRK